MKFSSMAEVVKMTTYITASYENLIKKITFLFQST